jgi:hypothetical protein
MMKIAEQVDEPEDPFAVWESIDLIKSQNDQLRIGIKRLSDEEELLGETKDGEALSIVSIAAKLASSEEARAEQWRLRRDAEGSRDVAMAAADSLRREQEQLRSAVKELKFALFSSDMRIKDLRTRRLASPSPLRRVRSHEDGLDQEELRRAGESRWPGRIHWGQGALLGTITGARGGHLRIKLDGDFGSNPYHPTWELRYLDAPAQVRIGEDVADGE